jgi:D-3-phosphoglycerate dehydrogenase
MADNRPVRGDAQLVLEKAGEIIKVEDTGEEDFIKDMMEIDPDIMVVGARNVNDKVLSSAKNLKGVIVYGVSYDFVDVEAATKHGKMVSNTPGVNAVSVAEFALGLCLTLLKNITRANNNVKNSEWTNMTTFRFGHNGSELYNKTVGIIGLGTIGSTLANRINAMGAKVISYTKNPSDVRAKQHNVLFKDLNTVMSESDIVICCAALTNETVGLIGKEQLELMKNNSYFVNVSRGALVDEETLYNILKNEKIAGAALDVIIKEPNTDSPFFKLDNVICTPHIAGRTIEAGQRLEMTVAEDALRISQGKIPKNIVNKEVLK